MLVVASVEPLARLRLDARLSHLFGEGWRYSAVTIRWAPPGFTLVGLRVIRQAEEVLSVEEVAVSLRLHGGSLELGRADVRGGALALRRASGLLGGRRELILRGVSGRVATEGPGQLRAEFTGRTPAGEDLGLEVGTLAAASSSSTRFEGRLWGTSWSLHDPRWAGAGWVLEEPALRFGGSVDRSTAPASFLGHFEFTSPRGRAPGRSYEGLTVHLGPGRIGSFLLDRLRSALPWPGPATAGLGELDLQGLRGQLRLVVEGADTWLALTRLEGLALGGVVAGEGRVRLGSWPDYDLSLSLEGGEVGRLVELLGLRGIDMRGQVGIEARLTGLEGGDRLEGRVALDETVVSGEPPCLTLSLQLDSLSGGFQVSPELVRLGPLEGVVAGGKLGLRFEIDRRRTLSPWKLDLSARGLDAGRLLSQYLRPPNRISGRLDGSLLARGQGSGGRSFMASGHLRGEGTIAVLESLGTLEAEYHLRGLHDIRVRDVTAQLLVHGGRVKLRDLTIASTHGDGRGELELGIPDCELEGRAELALDRRVLGGARKLVSLLEGGRRFNVSLSLGGTAQAPTLVYRSH